MKKVRQFLKDPINQLLLMLAVLLIIAINTSCAVSRDMCAHSGCGHSMQAENNYCQSHNIASK